MTADRNLRQAVAELMLEVHLISPFMAAYLVSTYDDFEVARRWRMYTGLELSAEGRTSKSDPDLYQVFGLATATARRSVLNSAPVDPEPINEARDSLPELDEKTWSLSGDGRRPAPQP